MVSKINSLGLFGLDSFIVEIEADLSQGLPTFDMVGLPDASVKESRDRVRSALKNCGFDYPVSRITVNLAPADIRKEGPVYDLPILLALLRCSAQIEHDFSGSAFIGELSLSGDVRPINGILPMTIKAKNSGFHSIFVPSANGNEASIVEGINVYPVSNIQQLFLHLKGIETILPASPKVSQNNIASFLPDFADVKGQLEAKRALEIAAAGNHNILLIGPPGSGKSMLAKRIPSILPDMSFEECIEVTNIHSISGNIKPDDGLISVRPFRSPHHTVSPAGLSGGGYIPKPGEVSLAHNGVLFLDELPEFSRNSMEVLRQPIEDGIVTISRVNGTLSYPCNVMLICAMNPCPCGNFGHPNKKCTCTSNQVSRYLGRVSGPLLDRLDLHIEVPAVSFQDMTSTIKSESSENIRARINLARNIQLERFKDTGILSNSRMSSIQLQKFCRLSNDATKLLSRAFETLGLSARAYDKILKIARTIADLDGISSIQTIHLSEALQYRSLDRKYWQK